MTRLTWAGGESNGLFVKSNSMSDDMSRKAGGIVDTLLQEKLNFVKFFSLLNSEMRNCTYELTTSHQTEAYSEPCQPSKMECYLTGFLICLLKYQMLTLQTLFVWPFCGVGAKRVNENFNNSFLRYLMLLLHIN